MSVGEDTVPPEKSCRSIEDIEKTETEIKNNKQPFRSCQLLDCERLRNVGGSRVSRKEPMNAKKKGDVKHRTCFQSFSLCAAHPSKMFHDVH